MTKRELVVRISRETGLIQEDVYAVVQRMLGHIIEALGQGDHIELRDFGVFDVCTRKPRVGRNPNKPEHVVTIPERKVIKFKAGKKMKEALQRNSADSPPAAAPAPRAPF